MAGCIKFSTKRFVIIDDELFTVYIKKIYIWWTLNKQKRYDKRGGWKIEEEIRFEFDSLKASFPSHWKDGFFGCWHECSYAIIGSGGTFLREKIAQKHLRMKKCSLLTTPSYNPKNSQSMHRGPIESNTRLTDQRLDTDFYSREKLWINIHGSGRAFSNPFLFSKGEKKNIYSSIRNRIGRKNFFLKMKISKNLVFFLIMMKTVYFYSSRFNA